MDIVLATNTDNPRLEFRDCEKFGDDSGFKTDVFVRSGDFALQTTFYFEKFPLTECIKSLSEMAESLTGSAILKPMWEDDFIMFEMLDLGHLSVTGKFTQHSPYEQKMKFGFETDQTAVRPLSEGLKLLNDFQGVR
jgi:hypothetical protein